MRKLLVLLAACALVVAFTVPAKADVSFYGYIGMWTGMDDDSKEWTATDYSDEDLQWGVDQGGNSRFGAKFKEGPVGGNVEIRIVGGTPGAVTVRQWHGTWNFGAGTLLVGQAWCPAFASIFGQNHMGGNSGGYGSFYGGLRTPQIAVHFGGLKIALETPNTENVVIGATDTDTTLPRLAASYSIKLGPAAIKLFGMYNTYDETVVATDKGYTIDSYGYGANVSVPLGPAYVKAIGWIGKNPDELGLVAYGLHSAYYVAASDSIEDVDAMGYGGAVGFKASSMLSFEVGYAATKSEMDNGASGVGEYEMDKNFYYIVMPITVAKNVTISPEIGKLDAGDTKVLGVTTDNGDETYYGVYWKIAW